MRTRARLIDGVVYSVEGKPRITLELSSTSSLAEIVGLDDVTLEIKKYYPKRSLDQNALAWEFIGRLAEKTKIPRGEIYRACIKDIGGASFVAPIKSEKIERVCKAWSEGHLGRQADILSESKIDGYTNVAFYFGSSDFDTDQMSRLIDSILQDCEAVGIDTTPLAEMALSNDKTKIQGGQNGII